VSTSDAFNARKGKGRPKGSPNKVTRELRALAAKYTAKGVKALAEIAFTKAKPGEWKDPSGYRYDGAERAKAIAQLMDRAHGKAPIAVTGEGGTGPVSVERIERIIVAPQRKDEKK
jgi:hypothetical protein